MLANHRRAFVWSLTLLAACVAALFAVGRHPPEAAPFTTLPFIGRFDASMHTFMDDIQIAPLTWLSKALNFLGGGLVMISLRIVALLVLVLRRRWVPAIAFAATWLTAELALTWLKVAFHRGRPPGVLVDTRGFSFPSGHAVAAAATTVALVLAFMPPGPRRRLWEWLAVGFSFVMAFSRVYLSAHWFSDVVAGVLLGAGFAIFWAATVTESRDIWFLREGMPIPPDEADYEAEPAQS